MIVLRELAPAKVNLYLHVTGRRADGYHLLDSLTGFTDAADKLEVIPAADVTLVCEGPFTAYIPEQDNSVLRAAKMLRAHTGVKAGAALTLHKHLPVAAGLGGGSADAAAALRLLMRFWNVQPTPEALAQMALRLGADVPACLRSTTLYMEGIGEKIEKGPSLSGMSIVLANPGLPLPTADVFKRVKLPYSSAPRHPPEFATPSAAIEFLSKCRNDLQAPATEQMPQISSVLDALSAQGGCLLARMSGSGATCFGLFSGRDTAVAAAALLGERNNSWWIKEATLL